MSSAEFIDDCKRRTPTARINTGTGRMLDEALHRLAQADARIAELAKALEDLVAIETMPGESANDRFERVAELFHRDTGYLAPGKSCAGGVPYEDRVTEWEAWHHERRDKALAATSVSHQTKEQDNTGRPSGLIQ